MKLLLDECLPRKLKNHLPEHECSTVPEQGWAGKKNGELLLLAANSGFDVFLTLDRGVQYEQNLKGCEIAVVLISAKSSRLADLLPRIPAILTALRSVRVGHFVRVPG
jgi:predicted nuclease of predicted toxin-antitoxin system